MHFLQKNMGTGLGGLSPASKGSWDRWLVVGAMEKKRTIIAAWLQNKSSMAKEQLLSDLGQQVHMTDNIPVDGIIEQLAAGLMAVCASELGLTPMELTGLLRTPRKDALAGLVTVLHSDV